MAFRALLQSELSICLWAAEGLTLRTYDPKAFLTPSYTGTLALAR
jgi:hypothetical protein